MELQKLLAIAFFSLIIIGVIIYYSYIRTCCEETELSKNTTYEYSVTRTNTHNTTITTIERKIHGNVTLMILVDNYPDPSGRLKSAWGLSILVKTVHGYILFDTGPDPGILKNNLLEIGIDPAEIKAVVISHAHGDHTGGLSYILSVKKNLTIYIPGRASRFLEKYIIEHGGNPVGVYNTTMIYPGIYVLGELYGPPWEQALVVESDKGYILLVGCSHPGIVNIVEKVVSDLGKPPYLVIGGFHMAGSPPSECLRVINSLIGLGVQKIAPIHCSGDTIREILRTKYSNYYLEAYTGKIITV